jgi:hypothetical protein
MKIHLHTLFWDDEFLLAHFFQHYHMVDRFFIYYQEPINETTLAILSANPRIELRVFVRSIPDSFALSELALSNECWKSRCGDADWVIVIDIDEFIVHPRLGSYLEDCHDRGITMVPSLGFEMISDVVPLAKDKLNDVCRLGVPSQLYSKLCVFNPNEIKETNFTVGRHAADPIGNVISPSHDELRLLHYKYIGFDRTFERQKKLGSALGELDIANDWGYQYLYSKEDFARLWNDRLSCAVDAYTADLAELSSNCWWGKYRSVG